MFTRFNETDTRCTNMLMEYLRQSARVLHIDMADALGAVVSIHLYTIASTILTTESISVEIQPQQATKLTKRRRNTAWRWQRGQGRLRIPATETLFRVVYSKRSPFSLCGTRPSHRKARCFRAKATPAAPELQAP